MTGSDCVGAESYDNDPLVLVSAQWLNARLNDPELVVLDASWFLPGAGRDAAQEFEQCHIPGAQFIDIEQIRDFASDLPHMLPSPSDFEAAVHKLAVSRDAQVVVYDGHGLFSAARAWWMFKVMGHERVAVLDGGLPAWRAAGYDVAQGASAPKSLGAKGRDDRLPFKADMKMQLVCDAQQVLAASEDPSVLIVDARPAGRFSGELPEPRADMRAGHIPNAYNVPFSHVLTSDGHMQPVDALKQAVQGLPLSKGKRVIASCGSGVTAAILCLALARLGHQNFAVYDGSWSEWGARHDLPIE